MKDWEWFDKICQRENNNMWLETEEAQDLILAIKLMREALEKYVDFEIRFRSVGGIYNPKTKDFNRDIIFDTEPMNPAKDVLEKCAKGNLLPE